MFGDPEPVVVGELLAEVEVLAGGEFVGDDVRLTGLAGLGLPTGLGTVTEGLTTRLGCGVGRRCSLPRCVCVAVGELRC